MESITDFSDPVVSKWLHLTTPLMVEWSQNLLLRATRNKINKNILSGRLTEWFHKKLSFLLFLLPA
jgi:hypothetical protein